MHNFKILLPLVIICLLIITPTYSCQIDSEIDKYFNEVTIKHERLKYFVNVTNDWDNGLISDEFEKLDKCYQTLLDLHNDPQIDESETVKDSFMNMYEAYNKKSIQLYYAKGVFDAYNKKQKEWENEYFRLWEKVFHWKQKVDFAYVKEVKSNTMAILGSESESTFMKKKHLYLSYDLCYKELLHKIKLKRQYKDRIPHEIVIIELSEQMMNLLGTPTNALEKVLKRTEGVDDKMQLILDSRNPQSHIN